MCPAKPVRQSFVEPGPTKFALLDSGSTLHFKVDDATRARYVDAGSEQFMTMPYWSVPVDVLEDDEALHTWARDAMAVGHATAKKRR